MAVDAQAYRRQLFALLPSGIAWPPPERSTRLGDLLEALGEELARVDGRLDDALTEADPRTTSELLGEWEQQLGLPAPAAELETTLTGRRFAVVAKLTNRGGQSRAHFSDVAKALGYAVEPEDIEEHAQFRAGQSAAGDALLGSNAPHAWTVHAPIATATFARAGEVTAGEPICSFGNDPLEAHLRAAAPAHSTVVFAYDQPYQGYGPWRDLEPTPTEVDVVVPQFFVYIEPL